jgi:predicted nucleotidyltransferase
MEEFHKIALTEAVNWIESNYKPIGIIASGSIIRGNPNKDSDFDIYVIHEQPFRQRIQKYFNQVPCEIFVNNIDHTKSSFLEEQRQNRPVTAHLISTGLIIKGNDHEIVKLALKDANEFKNKPKEITEYNLTLNTYLITNLLEDANDTISSDPLTCEYILNRTLDKFIDFWFVLKRIPLPRIKERMITIKNIDVEFYNKIKLIYSLNDISQKLKQANDLIELTISKKGFFEWESEQQ